MAFHIRNRQTDLLARKLARVKRVGLTQAIHEALEHELERAQGRSSRAETAVAFCRELRARGRPSQGQPADKRFFDELSGQ